jgi:hypothetical protein
MPLYHRLQYQKATTPHNTKFNDTQHQAKNNILGIICIKQQVMN